MIKLIKNITEIHIKILKNYMHKNNDISLLNFVMFIII